MTLLFKRPNIWKSLEAYKCNFPRPQYIHSLGQVKNMCIDCSAQDVFVTSSIKSNYGKTYHIALLIIPIRSSLKNGNSLDLEPLKSLNSWRPSGSAPVGTRLCQKERFGKMCWKGGPSSRQKVVCNFPEISVCPNYCRQELDEKSEVVVGSAL